MKKAVGTLPERVLVKVKTSFVVPALPDTVNVFVLMVSPVLAPSDWLIAVWYVPLLTSASFSVIEYSSSGDRP